MLEIKRTCTDKGREATSPTQWCGKWHKKFTRHSAKKWEIQEEAIFG
jgi:hypothetical protein